MRNIIFILFFLPAFAFSMQGNEIIQQLDNIFESESFKSKNREVQKIANCIAVNHFVKSDGAKLSTQDSLVYSIRMSDYVKSEGLELMVLQNAYTHTLSHNYAMLWSMKRVGQTKMLKAMMSVVSDECPKYPAI
ncbi:MULTISPECIES: hypothetical protein [Pseudoalteromonas]|uniref:hypothetical protein n=1 Tax=Pseudoalteromonas TaxID=53246 RepID=UPI0015FE5390|nr:MULTISPECIES: hypothetical protein [unclassified Pseudoalteromonas]MBB1378059.1 hypothetical protein [Pseudoalteromonas sp. SR43-2]MBH0004313.1 hypothetical protein [Pseudoalteromonas sp. SWYJZ12]|tara:strand:+ start:1459 stop:1860 length:402 start_codon:yes stop_codon:yes gene_type:complete